MAKPRKSRRRPSRRAGRFLGLYVFLSVILITAVVVAGCIVFFKVNQFQIEGNHRYTTEEIVEASGISTGDNLCLVKKTDAAGKVLSRLSYVHSVNIRRKLPDTIIITVVETDAVAAIKTENSWWLINAEGKLLEEVEDAGDFIEITGLPLLSPKSGDIIDVEADYRLMRRSLIELLTAMQGRELLEKVRSIKCSDEAQLVMDYNGQLKVKMRTDADYDYQVKMLEAVLKEYVDVNWSKDDKGTLDMTYEDGHPHLTKNSK